ncbi:MAG: serine/threonine protein phosphatase [Oscillibacter sp.]
MDCYLDSLLTCGRAVGEIVPDAEGREIAAVLCADVSQVEVREGDNPLEFCLCGVDGGGRSVPLEYQDLLLFTPLNPEAGHPYGVSMLRSMPYLTGLLLKIYDAMGKNWDRCGNVRFAVTYKPQDGELDRGAAQERAEQIAEEWSRAMQEGRNGSVRDFVSVGDVSIKAIGADNQILDSETPVRQILEQLVAKTGLPPFMLGLSWSSTERMSAQQADMLTSEITALRRTLEPVIERVCTLWLRMHGYGCRAVVDWEDINLQDEEVEEAKAALTHSRRESSGRKMMKRRGNEHGSEKREQWAQKQHGDARGTGNHQSVHEARAQRGRGLHLCRAAVRQRGGPGRRALSARDARRARGAVCGQKRHF